jgi:uncharacterized caspase-like protein
MTIQKSLKILLILPLIFFIILSNPSIGASPKNNRNDVNPYTTGSVGSKTKSENATRVTKETSGTRYALLIGVNQYDNSRNEKQAKEAKRPFFSLKNLNYSCNDMTVLSQTLVNCKFTTSDKITLLTSSATEENKKSTLTNINRELKNLLSLLKPNDTIFIAFAGHGLALPNYKGEKESELYLCPMDAEIICNPNTGKFDCRSLLSRKILEGSLKDCQASIKILAMDACRENASIATRSIAQNDLITETAMAEIEKIKEFTPKPVEGLFQLFSCDEGQTAAEYDPIKHGVYSFFMIKGLKGDADANANNDGYITLSELQRYVKDKTSAYSTGVIGGHNQTPKIIAIGDSTGEDVVLAVCTPTKPQIDNSSNSNNNSNNNQNLSSSSNRMNETNTSRSSNRMNETKMNETNTSSRSNNQDSGNSGRRRSR